MMLLTNSGHGGMMKAFLLLAGAIIFFVAGCAHFGRPVEPPSVRLVNVMPASSSLFEQRLDLTLRVTNPNPFALSWTGYKVNSKLNDMNLLSAVSSENGRVEALGETLIKVEASASTFDLLRQIMTFQGGQTKLTYALEGVFYRSGVQAGGIPFSSEGELWDSKKVQ
jgi:LEA14-like dessication related protein